MQETTARLLHTATVGNQSTSPTYIPAHMNVRNGSKSGDLILKPHIDQ